QAAAFGRSQQEEIPALRGSIYAKDGTTLAYSEPRYDVYVWLPELQYRELKGLQTRADFTEKVGALTDYTGEQLAQYLEEMENNGVRWIKIAGQVTVEAREKIMNLTVEGDSGAKLAGYDFIETSKRIYPEGSLASQTIGLTNQDDDGNTIGLGGIEGEWDGNLEPIAGYLSGERDAKGNAIGISTERTIESVRGNSIYTSVDKHLQQIVEQHLKWAVETYNADSGSVVIMDPHDGSIMALANYPTYDANLRENKDASAYGNKAVSEPYEIGSVGKIFTLSTAIDLGVVTPDSVIIQGHNGCESISDDLLPVCTHDKLPQPPMPIKDAFALSDNIYFLHLGQLIEKQDFYNSLQKFGIGHASGVDLQGESFGYLKDWEKWNIADVSAYSYGHSYQINLVQATAAVAAVANGGVLMQPHVVQKVVQADGTEIDFEPQVINRVIKPETAALMSSMMYVIYQNNLFWWEHQYDDLRSYNIALKSGTALIPDKYGYTNEINATYAGYDANPEHTFVMLARLERPDGSLASMNTRVLWMEIFRDIKDYLGVKRLGQ
ncbi:penicillin-binding protein 2, partial [Candidatus Dojkabacteria bacterium]|nr:penicillin-binding protein 2 [Candidatus Dojkabacteria bacterium]